MCLKSKYSIYRLSILICSILYLSACANVEKNKALSFKDVYEVEHQYYKRESNWGLALSGGGTRSASFNIGVLAGLNSIDRLNDLDVMSTVSGGSYAAYWYYSKLYYLKDDTTDDLFKLCYSNNKLLEDGDSDCVTADKQYRFQRHLQNNSLILKKHSMGSGDDDDIHFGHFIPIGFRSIYEPPVSNIFELFGLDNNIYSARDYYREGIERTYGLYPDSENIKGLMSGGFEGEDDTKYRSNEHKVRAEALSVASIKSKLYTKDMKESNPPVWVINTTVAPGNDFRVSRLYSDPYENEPFVNSIYEITPFTVGSGLTGYITTEDAKDVCSNMGEGDNCFRSVSDYVALSGAAVDLTPYTSGFGTLGMTFLGIYGIELGDYSLNPSDFDQPAYLSDGGHSDNLGAYSLVKRRVENIIISDAEADPDGKLGGLKRLVKQLDNENKTLKFYHKKGEREITKLNECLLDFDTQCISIAYDDDLERVVEDWELSPILLGKVKSNDGTLISNVFYVKLRALDKYVRMANQEEQYPKVTKHILEDGRDKKSFPHVSTVDVNFSPTQYYAYFSLGRFYGEALKQYLEMK